MCLIKYVLRCLYIEDELSGVIGIEKFSSISSQGFSVILVTLSPDTLIGAFV
jgi:multidrug efflux pump subunit AcrB